MPFILIAFIALAGCKGGGKKSMKGDEQVEAGDFISFFDDVTLPLALSDSLFNKKPGDSSQIEAAIFKQFINDSILKKEFGKTLPKIFALGKFRNGAEETYLLFRAVAPASQHVYVAAMNKENKFTAAVPVLSSAGVPGRERLTVDSKYNFTHADDTRAADGSSSTVTQVYAYNNAGVFMVILTDGVPAGTDLPIVDPNDTLSRKNKYAANYAKDKRNILTIRDGSKPQQVRFFIHIEKKEPQFCDGQLKGEAIMSGADSATFTGSGEPCSLGFKFSSNSIRVTETNCGNRHGMECSFNGSFLKQKPAVKAKEKKK